MKSGEGFGFGLLDDLGAGGVPVEERLAGPSSGNGWTSIGAKEVCVPRIRLSPLLQDHLPDAVAEESDSGLPLSTAFHHLLASEEESTSFLHGRNGT